MEKTIIEVRGMKMEVDLSSAKRIDAFRVGDNVKILKKRYSDSWESYPGVIVGFDNFEALPTIVVAYLESTYQEAKINFAYINAQTKDTEVCHMTDAEKIIDKGTAVEYLDRQIDSLERQITEIKARKNYFLQYFSTYMEKELTDGKKV
jgi:hypothetical protein